MQETFIFGNPSPEDLLYFAEVTDMRPDELRAAYGPEAE